MHKKGIQLGKKKGLLVISSFKNRLLSAGLVRRAFRYRRAWYWSITIHYGQRAKEIQK